MSGKPGDKANLVLETTGIRELVFSLEVSLQQCPPGFSYKPEERICACSVTTNKRFMIHSCDSSQFEAKFIQVYWIGYDSKELVNKEFGEEKFLLYAICPIGQCLNVNIKGSNPHVLELPN